MKQETLMCELVLSWRKALEAVGIWSISIFLTASRYTELGTARTRGVLEYMFPESFGTVWQGS